MKPLYELFIKVFPFTIGVILILTSLAFLADFTDHLDFGDEAFWGFVFFAVIGIPILLFGIDRASND